MKLAEPLFRAIENNDISALKTEIIAFFDRQKALNQNGYYLLTRQQLMGELLIKAMRVANPKVEMVLAILYGGVSDYITKDTLQRAVSINNSAITKALVHAGVRFIVPPNFQSLTRENKVLLEIANLITQLRESSPLDRFNGKRSNIIKNFINTCVQTHLQTLLEFIDDIIAKKHANPFTEKEMRELLDGLTANQIEIWFNENENDDSRIKYSKTTPAALIQGIKQYPHQPLPNFDEQLKKLTSLDVTYDVCSYQQAFTLRKNLTSKTGLTLEEVGIHNHQRHRYDLFAAAVDGNVEIFDDLLPRPNVDIEATSPTTDSTLLMCAAESRDTTLLKRILAIGRFNLNAQDKGGRTAVMKAAIAGNQEAVELLMAQPNINVNLFDRRGIHLAYYIYEKFQRDICRQLLRSCDTLDLNRKNQYGKSISEVALEWGNGPASAFFSTIKICRSMAELINLLRNPVRNPASSWYLFPLLGPTIHSQERENGLEFLLAAIKQLVYPSILDTTSHLDRLIFYSIYYDPVVLNELLLTIKKDNNIAPFTPQQLNKLCQAAVKICEKIPECDLRKKMMVMIKTDFLNSQTSANASDNENERLLINSLSYRSAPAATKFKPQPTESIRMKKVESKSPNQRDYERLPEDEIVLKK